LLATYLLSQVVSARMY